MDRTLPCEGRNVGSIPTRSTMHIFKSRNPLWLIGDIILAVWLWRIPLFIPALFFTLDSLLQLIYTFFPEMIDTLEKKMWFRFMYISFFILALLFIIKAISSKGLI
jgi:hypothetical protein